MPGSVSLGRCPASAGHYKTGAKIKQLFPHNARFIAAPSRRERIAFKTAVAHLLLGPGAAVAGPRSTTWCAPVN